ncbi:hypothetical protein EMCRGX_G015631 [Ephydatia muelleri]
MMGGFRLQMAHELSCGVLYALQSDSDCDDMEIDQTDQLGDDGDMDDEDNADESDEERTADPNFLVPTYENEPDPNDIFALKWGKDHYFKYLPRLKRMPYTEEQCPFEREFIRKVVKEMEIDSALVFQSTLNPLKVLEIFHYLMETESDVKLTVSVCTSRINKIIVWPEQQAYLKGLQMKEAEVRKHRANDPKCSELGWVCIPLAVETYGNWGREAQSTFSRLASHLAIITSSHKSKALYSRLNFTLVRAVARALVAAVRPSCPFCVELGIEGRRVQFDIDTGSAVTLVSERTWKKLNLDVKLRNSRVLLRTYTGDPISVVGEAKVAVSYNQQLSTLVLYVVKGTGPSLLGRDWLRHIKLDWKTVGQVASVNRATMLDSLLKRYHEVFQGGLGTLKGVHARLQVKPNAVPKFFKARTVPFAELNSKAISTSSVTEEVKQVSSSTSTSVNGPKKKPVCFSFALPTQQFSNTVDERVEEELKRLDDVLESARACYKAEREKKRDAERERYQAEPEKKRTAERESYQAEPEKKRAAKRQLYWKSTVSM